MKRWNIERSDCILKLYYKDFETAKNHNPKAISITECFDYDYLKYVDVIKAAAIETLYDYKGRKVFKIPHNSAYILIRLLCDIENGKEFYYDSCEFQRHDEYSYTTPIMWTCSTPQEFWKQFLMDSSHAEFPIELVSLHELKKLKPVKFYNRENSVFYRDCNGYFYYVCKSDLPNKKAKEEYEIFKGNKGALWVGIGKSSNIDYYKWFESEDAFFCEYEQYKSNTPISFGMPFYQIKKIGYTKQSPDDRKVIFRLPYFQLNKEIYFEKRESQNHNGVSHRIAHKWCGMMEGYTQFGDAFENMDWVENLVERWREYAQRNGMEDVA